MNTIDLLDRPIAFHRCFVAVAGTVNAALLLSQAVYWHKRGTLADGWFWKTQEEWQEETGMSRRELDTARKACAKWLKHELRGVPATSHYKLDVDALQTSLAGSAKLGRRKEPSQSGGKRQTISTETTAETTKGKLAAPATPSSPAPMKALTDGWCQAYERVHGRKYAFGGDKDGTAAARLLKLGVEASVLLGIAEKAWAHPGWFWCKQAATLAGFAAGYNNIRHELDHPPKEARPAGFPPSRNGGEFRYGQPGHTVPGMGNY